MISTWIDVLYLGIFSIMIFSGTLWLLVYFFNRDKIQSDPEIDEFKDVTFLVPAYNEEDYVAECIESLLDLDYPQDKIDIIAINDGSDDNTLEELRKFKDKIEIIDKGNSGKANSINQALEKVETELVACMDADSFAEPQMLKAMIGYFEDEDVKGVTPAMKVRNPTTWAQKVMWAEYIYNVFLRKLFSIFDSQWVMPGPGSVYETEYLKEIGGWDEETLTEDMEVAFRMFKRGAKIKNSTNAYVDTESPPTFRGLLRQRVRWYRGYLSNMLRYDEFWFNPVYGNLGVIILPFNILFTAVTVFLLGHLIFRIVDGAYQMLQAYLLTGSISPGTFYLSVQSLSLFHIFYAIMGVSGVLILFLSLRTAEEKLGLWERRMHYILFLTIYGMLYAVFWIAAVIQEIRGDKRW